MTPTDHPPDDSRALTIRVARLAWGRAYLTFTELEGSTSVQHRTVPLREDPPFELARALIAEEVALLLEHAAPLLAPRVTAPAPESEPEAPAPAVPAPNGRERYIAASFPDGVKLARCSTCHAPVAWGVTALGKRCPFEYDLALRGVRGDGQGHYVTHFSTCPQAPQHTRKGRA